MSFARTSIKLLYIDKDIAVISKPSSLLSVQYPGSKEKSAIDILEKIMRSRGLYHKGHRPIAVHRLDRDTSGVMMFALNPHAQKILMDNWQTIVTERLYIAVAERLPHARKLDKSGTINMPLAQNAWHQSYVPTNSENLKTQSAITHYKVLQEGKTHLLLELSLETGRKNQIRAHLSAMGYTIAGDKNYKAHTNPFNRLALHAYSLCFYHPTTKELMTFKEEEPKEWKSFVIR